MQMGLTRYKGIITVGIDHSHLSLAVMKIFKFGHEELIIPLQDIQGIISKGIFNTYVKLTISRLPSLKIFITKKLADKLAASSNDMWGYSE